MAASTKGVRCSSAPVSLPDHSQNELAHDTQQRDTRRGRRDEAVATRGDGHAESDESAAARSPLPAAAPLLHTQRPFIGEARIASATCNSNTSNASAVHSGGLVAGSSRSSLPVTLSSFSAASTLLSSMCLCTSHPLVRLTPRPTLTSPSLPAHSTLSPQHAAASALAALPHFTSTALSGAALCSSPIDFACLKALPTQILSTAANQLASEHHHVVDSA